MHWFYDPKLDQTTVSLPTEEAKHAVSSLRISAGEKIAITNGQGLVYFAEVELSNKSELRFRVFDRKSHSPAKYRLSLIQALAKNDRDELALQTSAELGVSRVFPWQSERSVVRWSQDKAERNLNRWRQIAIESLKQSQQAFLTEIPTLFTWDYELSGTTLVLDPAGDQSLLDVKFEPNSEINLFVGPEGGFSQFELDKFAQLGFQRVKLGEAVLRSSNAGPAAISAIKTLLRIW